MSQHYSDQTREDEPTALPDVETFYVYGDGTIHEADLVDEDGVNLPKGWYYWFCFPGCLPDSDPIGPFDSEAEALADARDNG